MKNRFDVVIKIEVSLSLEFQSVNCVPCKAQNPETIKIQDRMCGLRLSIILI